MRNRKPPQKMVTWFQEIFSRITNPLDAKDCGEGKNPGWQLAALDHCIQQLWCVTFSFFFLEKHVFLPFLHCCAVETSGGGGAGGDRVVVRQGLFCFCLITLWDPMDCSLPGSFVHGILQQDPLSMGFSRQENLSGLPFSSPGDLPTQGWNPGLPLLQVDSLLPSPREAQDRGSGGLDRIQNPLSDST